MNFVRWIGALIVLGAAILMWFLKPMEKFEKTPLILKTLDDKNIAATFYAPKGREEADILGGIVYAHMMPATKESWDALAIKLAESGFMGLAIDLRGHGDSDGGPKGYAKFSDAEHQKSILDLDSAAKYLIGKGFTADQVAFIGASIGANLSLKYIADNNEFKTNILLSPGLNYRGIETEPLAVLLQAGQRVFVVSARDDGDNSSGAKAIFEAMPEGVEKRLEIFETGGHGTTLFETQKNLSEMILEFLTR